MTNLRASVLLAALGAAFMGEHAGQGRQRAASKHATGPQLKTGTRADLRAKRKKERKAKKRSQK